MKDWDQRSLEKLGHEDKIRKCPECGSEYIEFDGKETICKKCGLVIE